MRFDEPASIAHARKLRDEDRVIRPVFPPPIVPGSAVHEYIVFAIVAGQDNPAWFGWLATSENEAWATFEAWLKPEFQRIDSLLRDGTPIGHPGINFATGAIVQWRVL